MAEIRTEIAQILETDQSEAGKIEWTECLTKFNRLAFLGSRHITGNYLNRKYRNTDEKIQLSSINEIDWEDNSFRTMIEGLAIKAKLQKTPSDVNLLENKLDAVKATMVTVEDLKQLCKHYVKKC